MSVLASVVLGMLITFGMIAALVLGWVPSKLVGPVNERIFVLAFGVAEGLLIAVALRVFWEER